MPEIGKILMGIGLLLLVVGAAAWGLGRAGFHGLPGDVRYEGQHLRINFPIVTCLVLSVVMSALLWLWQWLGRK
jgi:Protein of unknown function (DUF2905)